jgi:hypothetical protein
MYLFLLILVLLALSVIVNKLIWKEEITLGEMFINIGVISLMLVVFWTVSYQVRVSDVEILNGEVLGKSRNKVSCSHSYPCQCRLVCSGSGKNKSCSTHCKICYIHFYDFDYVVNSNIGTFY